MGDSMHDGALVPRRVSLIFLIGSCLQLLLNVVFANFLRWGHPWDTFLFYPVDRFNDFYNQARVYSADVIRPSNLCKSWLHLDVLAFRYSVRILGETVAFLSCLSIFLVIHWGWVWSCLKRSGRDRSLFCVVIALFNYPTVFAIDRGNTEVLIYAANVLIFVAFTKRWYTLSALLVAISVNHKPFPVVFLLLFVRKRLWSRIILSLVVAGLIFWFCGLKAESLRSRDYHDMFTKYAILKYETGPLTSHYGHSFFSLFKMARVSIVGHKHYYDKAYNLFIVYGVVAALTTAGCGVLFWRYRLLMLDQLLLITTLEMALPWTSGDYTLLHTFLPLGLLLRRRATPSDRKIAYLLAALMIPKHYFWFALTPSDEVVRMTNLVDHSFGISTSGVIAPIIQFVIFIYVIINVLIRERSRRDRSSSNSSVLSATFCT